MPPADLAEPRSARAKALIRYLTGSVDPVYGRVEAVTHGEHHDLVDIVVEPELVQRRKVPILDEEPIRIAFPVDDDRPPKIYARREDFPVDLVHTNFERSANGTSLCIWEENWDDLKRKLTAQATVERIRSWLSNTADGTIHQEGQALEPMIPATASTAILPPGEPGAALHIASLTKHRSSYIMILEREAPANRPGAIEMALFQLMLPPQVHGSLRNAPGTLAELAELVADLGIDLLQALGEWVVAPEQLAGADQRVLILIYLPKKASPEAGVKAWDVWGLQPTEQLFAIGERLGRTGPDPVTGQPRLLIPAVAPGPVDTIDLIQWRIVHRLDRSIARNYAASALGQDLPLVAIGAGAIGSNLMVNATRAGLGPWTVIDADVNLPHNLVRQAQLDTMVGDAKALSAAVLLNALLADHGNQGIVANYLAPEEDPAADIGTALEHAPLTIDFSASPAVLGTLADDGRVRRAASFFFNPSAQDLVVLCEDDQRALRIDEIEAQYFMAVSGSSFFEDHLAGARSDFVRYANACQDLTRPVPPWQIQTLCGIGGGRLQQLLASGEASAAMWLLHPKTGSIQSVRIALEPVHRQDFGEIRVSISADVVAEMRRLRKRDDPNETGGVLLGSVDLERRVVHVVKALPAPPDSRQSPTYFVRGKKHLKPIVDAISRRSAGAITYVGEWHSHPDRAKVCPSDDDENVFSYLESRLDPAQSPYLMAICGKGEVWLRAGWSGCATGEGTIVS